MIGLLRSEDGQVGGIEAVAFGLLIFVVGLLIVANAWGVIDAKMTARSAAREAARTYVKAPAGRDALVLAQQAGHEALASLGRRGDGDEIELVNGSFARCSAVTFRVVVHVPLISLPWIGSHGNGFTTTASHTEIVDPYRSGLPGTGEKGSASCA